MFIRFDIIHERDRRTDGHRMMAIAALMHSIARQKWYVAYYWIVSMPMIRPEGLLRDGERDLLAIANFLDNVIHLTVQGLDLSTPKCNGQ